MSNDALIADLSANLAPVKRRRAWREAVWLAVLGVGEIALMLGLGPVRSDMAETLGSAFMQWKLVSLAVVAGAAFMAALVSLSPTASPRRGLVAALVLAGAATIAGLFVGSGPAASAMHTAHLPHAYGPLCALAIVALSLPMLGLLAMLMRRAAPVQPEGSALAAGLAAGTWGALVFSLCCPSNDPVYVILWYGAGCALVAAAARWLLPRGFRL